MGVSIPVAILTLVLLGVVVLIVGAPLRAARREPPAGSGGGAPATPGTGEDASAEPGPEQLRAAREAKYREIRDAELDYRTGKLSREDYEAIDGDLRAEAIEILNRLEDAERRDPALESGP